MTGIPTPEPPKERERLLEWGIDIVATTSLTVDRRRMKTSLSLPVYGEANMQAFHAWQC